MRCPGENFGDRDFNSQEVVWMNAYEWVFQNKAMSANHWKC